MKSASFLILIMFSLVLVAQSPAPRQQNSGPAGNASNGRKLFVAYGCYECHGYEGQGGAGARLAPRPVLAFPAFVKYVRRPTQQMPPYIEKVVKDQELADIYSFLLSIPGPPPVSSLPQLAE